MNEPLDALIKQIDQGNQEALLEYIEQKRPQLTAFVQRSLSDAMKQKVEAVDIVQDVSLAAYNQLDDKTLNGHDPFHWLCQLAERKIIDTHRKLFGAQKRSADREVGLGSPGSSTRAGGFIDVLIASMTSPSKAFSKNQKEFRLLAAMDELPEIQRQALQMRYVEGLPTKEIAERLGKSDGNIRVMLSRTITHLQETLGE